MLLMLQCKYDLDHRAQQQQEILQKLGTRVNSFSATLVSSIFKCFLPFPSLDKPEYQQWTQCQISQHKERNKCWRLACYPVLRRYTCSHLFHNILLNIKDFKETGRFIDTFLHSIKAPKAGRVKKSIVFTIKYWECFRYMITREAVQPKNQLQNIFKVFWPGQQLLNGKQKFTKASL